MSYSPAIGDWMETDSAGYFGSGSDLYEFDDDGPGTTVDATGNQGASTSQPTTQPISVSFPEMNLVGVPLVNKPGSTVLYRFEASWVIAGKPNGNIIQHIVFTPSFYKCGDPKDTEHEDKTAEGQWMDRNDRSYYEDISVKNGKARFASGNKNGADIYTDTEQPPIDHWSGVKGQTRLLRAAA